MGDGTVRTFLYSLPGGAIRSVTSDRLRHGGQWDLHLRRVFDSDGRRRRDESGLRRPHARIPLPHLRQTRARRRFLRRQNRRLPRLQCDHHGPRRRDRRPHTSVAPTGPIRRRQISEGCRRKEGRQAHRCARNCPALHGRWVPYLVVLVSRRCHGGLLRSCRAKGA